MSQPTKQYDIYAAVLNFKEEVTAFSHPYRSYSWVPEAHQRRLQAYEILAAFYMNYSRDYRKSPESGDDGDNDDILEMGDAAWLCNKLKDKVLGERVRLSIPLPRVLKDNEQEAEILARREAVLQDWWDSQNISAAVDENETKCSYLGDCVYVVGWRGEDHEPAITTYDPGFYFPSGEIYEDSWEEGGGKVLSRVMFAWEEETDEDDSFLIYRDVYELRRFGENDTRCYRQSAYYSSSTQDTKTIEELEESDLTYDESETWVDLGIAFMPVVHVPNFRLQGEMYGLSNLTHHLHNIDSIINTDTDLSKNSTKLGGVTCFVSGDSISIPRDSTTGEYVAVEIQPGSLYVLGKDGRLHVLDTSTMQKALLDTKDYLNEKLIRNTGITEVGAGMMKGSDLPSGIALRIMMQPLIDKVKPMREQRRVAYTELFWMVQQFYLMEGTPEQKAVFAGTLYDVDMVFGEIVPADRETKLKEYLIIKDLFGIDEMLRIAKEEGMDIDIQAIKDAAKKAAEDQLKMEREMFNAGRREDTGEGDDE